MFDSGKWIVRCLLPQWERRQQRLHGNGRGRRRGKRLQACEPLETRRLLASDWHNALAPLNVDDSVDGMVSPFDALLVVNELNDRAISQPGTGALPTVPQGNQSSAFFDVNDDGYVSPLDALLVINNLGNLAGDEIGEENLLQDLLDGVNPDRDPLSALSLTATQALGLTMDSGEVLLNTQTDRAQRDVDIAGSTAGYVAVWVSKRQDGSGWGVFGQRFAADGARLGGEFQVNTHTNKSQRAPVVAMADDGSFVVVWESKGQDGSGWGIFGQRYNATGARVGAEFLVNQTTRGTQRTPAVAFATDGDFVVVWNGRGAGDSSGIFARRFDANGVAQGGEFLVNQTTKGHQLRPDVAGTTGGGVIIVWDRKGAGDNKGVFVRRFDANNQPLGAETLVGVSSDGVQRHAAVSVAEDGSIVVAWQHKPEPEGWGVRAQRFTAAGAAVGTPIVVNQTTESVQKRPDIAHLSDNSFVIGWYGFGEDDRRGIYVRRFQSTGLPMNEEGLVNASIAGKQRHPALASIPGGVVVAWEGRGIGELNRGVYARNLRTTTGATGPTITPVADRMTDQGTAVTVDIVATDPNTPANQLIYNATATGGATVAFDPSVRNRLTVTPAAGFTGDISVNVTVSDGQTTASDTFIITVNAAAQPPVITAIADQTTEVDTPLTLDVTATDPDTPAEELTYSATATGGATATFDSTVRNRLTVTPATGFTGDITVTVTVSDGAQSAMETFIVTVEEQEAQPPVITAIADQTTGVDTPLTLDVTATDPDTPAEELTYSATATGGATATFDSTVRNRLTVTPATGFTGDITVTVTVSDGAQSAMETFIVTVEEQEAQPPVITAIADQTTGVDTPLTLDVMATDPDTPAEELTYSATATGGATATFDSTVRNRLTVTPATGFTGDITVAVTVSDGAQSAMETFIVTVEEQEAQPPVITAITDQTTGIDTPLTLDVMATDPDTPAEELTYSATATEGATATFDSTVRNRLTVTPATGFTGDITVTVTVSDGAQSAMETFIVTVEEQEAQPPVITAIADRTTGIDTPLTLDVMATDPDTPAEELTYSATATEGATATFDSTVRNRLTITPATGFIGDIDVTVTVSDGEQSTMETFTVTVSDTPPGNGPILDAIDVQETEVDTPLTIDLGVTDNDTPLEELEFTAFSTTPGATLEFDPQANNRLTITPPAGFVGQFDVSVRVTDVTESDTATFLVNAVDPENVTVEVMLEVAELDATPGIVVGEEFDIEIRFQDVVSDQAVFAGYLDVLFDNGLVEVDSISYADNYPALRLGTIDNGNGIVDEAGATDGVQPPPDTLILVLRVTALDAGAAVFTTNVAEGVLAETVIYGNNFDQRDNTFFGGLIVEITEEEE